jgi:thymidine kinase
MTEGLNMDELIILGSDDSVPRVPATTGWIEVIAGSMFSGKSEELIRRLRRAKIARQKVQVFKPDVDTRFSNDHIVSHSEMRHESANIRTAAELLARIEPDTEVVGIDEGQFFDNALVDIANHLARRGVRVIIAGLDQDYTGKPWEPMPQLLAIAEYITKTHAICMKCGQPANYSQRIFESEERVAVGAAGMYEARCRKCFVPHADTPTLNNS